MFASKKSYREKKEELARVRVQLHALALENKKLEQLIQDSENASLISTHDYGLESPEDLHSALSGMKKMLDVAEEKAQREEVLRQEAEEQFQAKKHEYLQSAVSGMQTMLTETEVQLHETQKSWRSWKRKGKKRRRCSRKRSKSTRRESRIWRAL